MSTNGQTLEQTCVILSVCFRRCHSAHLYTFHKLRFIGSARKKTTPRRLVKYTRERAFRHSRVSVCVCVWICVLWRSLFATNSVAFCFERDPPQVAPAASQFGHVLARSTQHARNWIATVRTRAECYVFLYYIIPTACTVMTTSRLCSSSCLIKSSYTEQMYDKYSRMINLAWQKSISLMARLCKYFNLNSFEDNLIFLFA